MIRKCVRKLGAIKGNYPHITPGQKPESLPQTLWAPRSQSSLSASGFQWSIPCTALGPEWMPRHLARRLGWGTCTVTLTVEGWRGPQTLGIAWSVVQTQLLTDESGRRGLCHQGTRVFLIPGLPCCPIDLLRSLQVGLPMGSVAAASLARFHHCLSIPGYSAHYSPSCLCSSIRIHSYSPTHPSHIVHPVGFRCTLFALVGNSTPHPPGPATPEIKEWILELTGYLSRTRSTQ